MDVFSADYLCACPLLLRDINSPSSVTPLLAVLPLYFPEREVQVREVLPGYGAGFIAACLDACGGDPERAVHQLLEGTLPPELAALDPHMPAAPAANPAADPDGKGKGRAGAAADGAPLACVSFKHLVGCHTIVSVFALTDVQQHA